MAPIGVTAVDELHTRTAALRALARVRGGNIPGSRERRVYQEAVRAHGSERALLLAVHQRWQVNLLARLDQVLEQGTDDPHVGVQKAVVELSRDLPGFAALLAEHADDPVLLRARQKLADYVGQACGCGRPHPLVASPRGRTVARNTVRRPCVLAVRCRRRLVRLLVVAQRGPVHLARRHRPGEPRWATKPALRGA